MKKTVFFSLLMLGCIIGVNAQTIVDTTPQNRNVLIEAFNGISGFGYDPAGHRISDEIMDSLDGHAWVINLHPATNDTRPYSTPYDVAISQLANNDAYPKATFNRHPFNNIDASRLAIGRNYYHQAADAIRALPAPVNIAAQGSIDQSTRMLTLHVEAYYTASSSQTTNLLNIALIQDNIIGDQTQFAGSEYPEMTVGIQYRHMHMLRTMITGQWGVEIPATQGSFIDTTITFYIPQSYGNSVGSVPVQLQDLSFIVFITETHQEVLNVTKAQIINDQATFGGVKSENEDCSLTYTPYATVANNTLDTITNFIFNTNSGTITSSKTLYPFEADTFHLTPYTFTASGARVQHCANTASASLVSYTKQGGVTVPVNSASASITYGNFDIYTVNGPLEARIGLDYYASEESVELIYQNYCVAEWTEGGWSNFPGNAPTTITHLPNAQYYRINFSPAAPGIHILRIVDSYGDGMRITNDTIPSGVWLSDTLGQVLADSMGYTANIRYIHRDYYLNVTNTGDGSHSMTEYLVQVVAQASDPETGTVTGGGSYHIGDAVTLLAIPYGGATFNGWSNGVNTNPYTFYPKTDTTIIALMTDPQRISVTAIPNDPALGAVTGGGNYRIGDAVTLAAVPYNGASFDGWDNGVSDNPYTLYPTTDTTVVAIFTATTGIDDIQHAVALSYTSNGQVVVSGAEGQTVTLLDAVGRVISTRNEQGSDLRFEVPASGVYMVKIGDLPAFKVVVIK